MPDRPSRSRRSLDALACAVLAAAVLALYLPPALFSPGHALNGIDFGSIHDRRIAFAQETFARNGPHLPGWYPRELMGTPFWSNVQSFPFLPTRLALLWIPHDLVFSVAVSLAAILAAVFTYLFLRALDLGRIASVAGGWTFAASGFFASRVLAGHLPLLEAFASLPLLLWCVERIARTDPNDPATRHRLRGRFLALVLASFCVVLAGHPQVPAYAVAAAAIYAVARSRGRTRGWTLAAIGAGIASSAFVWWPMLQLIGRSTRILPLDPPDNDLAFPYWRLKAFFFPWADGWPPLVQRLPLRPFVDADGAKFWDTVCYVGWIPWIALAFLVERAIRGRRLPDRRIVLVGAIGLGALLLSLPIAQEFTSQFRVTLLRSPARLLYVTTFALSVGIAAALDAVARARADSREGGFSREVGFRHAGAAAALGILLVHGVDLGSHARSFVQVTERLKGDEAQFEAWRRSVGDHRISFDVTLLSPRNRAIDDVGFFDSIMLAKPYRAIMALAGQPESANIQTMDGKMLPPAALAGLCVESLITAAPRDDLQVQQRIGVATVFSVPHPARRASFVPDEAVAFVDDALVLDRYRRGAIDLQGTLFLPPSTRASLSPPVRTSGGGAPAPAPRVAYERPDPDAIVVRTESSQAGFLRLVESFDEGWSATLDGAPANVLVADTFAMAVRLPAGKHELRFAFRTPGALAGLCITAASAVLAAFLALRAGRTRPSVSA
jgi:hypothetical protein